jgi:predicted nucleic acid-binding Zn finger protein
MALKLMQTTYQLENELMNEAYTELKLHHAVSPDLQEKIAKTLGDRFINGLELADTHKVRRYDFNPSGRIVWVVQGRKEEYQVIPEIPFCYCDDYYFRVMEKKRGLCYHIIAQRIAEALEQYEKITKGDLEYSSITNRWRAVDNLEKKPTKPTDSGI